MDQCNQKFLVITILKTFKILEIVTIISIIRFTLIVKTFPQTLLAEIRATAQVLLCIGHLAIIASNKV